MKRAGLTVMRFSRDYYRVLGLPPNATASEIERAFRRLALTYHPDVNNSPEAEARFKEINEAYQVLSDPATRAATRPDHSRQSGWVRFADVIGLSAGGVYGWLVGLLVGGAIGRTIGEIGTGILVAIFIAFFLPVSVGGIYSWALDLAAPYILESLPLPVRKVLRFATLGAVGGAIVGVLGRATNWPLSCVLIGLLPLLIAWLRRAQG